MAKVEIEEEVLSALRSENDTLKVAKQQLTLEVDRLTGELGKLQEKISVPIESWWHHLLLKAKDAFGRTEHEVVAFAEHVKQMSEDELKEAERKMSEMLSLIKTRMFQNGSKEADK